MRTSKYSQTIILIQPFFKKFVAFILIIFCSFSCNNRSSHIEHPNQNTKPWAYWWWMGNSVTKNGITQNLKAYKDAGFGGLHIIPIYGEKGDEVNYIEYLSPYWMEMLVHTVSEATGPGMGIDMTTGTGWPFGGPNISLKHSAKRFELIELDLTSTINIKEITQGVKGGKLICLSALNENGTCDNITSSIQENGEIRNISTYKKAFALIIRPTGQKVKRAAPGGEGLVMDYFSKDALNNYFERFQSAFDSTKFTSGKVRAFYNDSYEVSGANFTSDFLAKFNELRGYDLTNYLHIIADTLCTETRERIVTDYRETLSDLLYSEFTKNWVQKSNELGMLARNQAHGSPGNILDLYGEADIPETESFGMSDFSIPGLKKDPDYEEERFGRPSPFTMKFASSAAHLKNKKLVASETATWLGDHFKVALSQVKPQIDELFTAGINHIIFHGITYNPPGKPFPGRLFYASTNFGTESHFWNELPALNKYIERCQTVLQNTKPHNDVLVYFPIHDLWAKESTGELIIHIDVHHSRKWLEETNFGEVVSQLWKDGFTFDYVSDKILTEARIKDNAIQFEGGEYKTLVVPKCTYIPDQTMENFLRLAEAGANIIFLEKLPKTVAGFNQLELREKKLALLKKQIAPKVKISNDISSELLNCGISPEEIAAAGLSFIRKKGEKGIVYFVSNLSDKFHTDNVKLSTEAKQVEIFDPLSGRKGIANSRIVDGKTEILLYLSPGQSCILLCSDKASGGEKWPCYNSLNDTITIDTEWIITPVSGAPKLPEPVKTKYLKSWTQFGDDYAVFSGKAVYSTEFEIDDKYINIPVRIDLGDVRETARLTINGNEIGLLWCIPYTTIIPSNILKRNNKIEIEVTNLSFNRVIDLDRKGVQWKNFNEINFVNIKYEPYNASDKEPVESGLLDEIKLIPVKKRIY